MLYLYNSRTSYNVVNARNLYKQNIKYICLEYLTLIIWIFNTTYKSTQKLIPVYDLIEFDPVYELIELLPIYELIELHPVYELIELHVQILNVSK